jgi:MFS family permease
VPTTLRVLLGANLVSSLGSGLTLPFLLIYLHDVRHVPLGLTGLLIGATALVGVPAGPVAGTLVDRLGARLVTVTTLLVAALGTVGLIVVRSAVSAIPVLIVLGFAQSALWPTWNALFAVMVPNESLRPRVFARSFQLLNLGLGAGAMVAGAVVHVSHPSSFTTIYMVDGVTYLAVVTALVLLPRSVFPRPARTPGEAHRHPAGGFRAVFADRRFRWYLGASAFLAFAGYAAVEAGLVGYATHVVRSEPYVIAWAFGMNTGLIVLLQPLGLAMAARFRRSTSLMVCAAFFGSSWAVLLVAGAFRGTALGDGLVVAMFGVFSLGEILLSPVGGPLVTMLAPPDLQGRYNATAASVYTTLGVLGPSIAGVLIAQGLGDLYLALLMVSAVIAMSGFWAMRRVLPPEIDNRGSTCGGIGRIRATRDAGRTATWRGLAGATFGGCRRGTAGRRVRRVSGPGSGLVGAGWRPPAWATGGSLTGRRRTGCSTVASRARRGGRAPPGPGPKQVPGTASRCTPAKARCPPGTRRHRRGLWASCSGRRTRGAGCTPNRGLWCCSSR